MNTPRFSLCLALTFLSGSLLLSASGARSKPKPRTGQAKAETLPTGMSITPTAARGSTLQALNPDLPERPEFTAGHPITTAISPDGNTLLILTSGFNRNLDEKGKAILGQSTEYVFVYDIRQNPAVKRQVLKVQN